MNDHLKSIAVLSCKNDVYTQLHKKCTAQASLTVLPTDKMFMFLFPYTTELQINMFKGFILGGFIRKIQQMTRRPDKWEISGWWRRTGSMVRQGPCRFKKAENTWGIQSAEQSGKRECGSVENVGLCIGETEQVKDKSQWHQ